MYSPNKPKPTKSEADHIELVKGMECVVCNTPGPSEAHEIQQGCWYTSVPLCADCHRGSKNGIHGQKAMWKVMKLNELEALNETIRRILYA